MQTPTAHSVRNGAIATIVGGIVLALLAKLWPAAERSLLCVWNGIVSFIALIGGSYSTPVWALLVLGFLALITIVRFVIGLSPGAAPAHYKYTQQFLYGANWRWVWSGEQISALWCYCPTCEAELVYDDSPARDRYSAYPARADFFCENCNKTVASIPGGGKSYAISAVKREIQRRVRTGEFAHSTFSDA